MLLPYVDNAKIQQFLIKQIFLSKKYQLVRKKSCHIRKKGQSISYPKYNIWQLHQYGKTIMSPWGQVM